MLSQPKKRSIFRKYWDAWLFLGACGLAIIMGAWAFDGVRLPDNLTSQPDQSVAVLSDSLPRLPIKQNGQIIGQVDEYNLTDDGQVAMTFKLNKRLDMRAANADLVTDPAPAIELVTNGDDAMDPSKARRRFTVHFAYADVLPLIATAAGNELGQNNTETTDVTQDVMDDAKGHVRRVFQDIYSHYHGIYSFFFPSENPDNTDQSE